MAMDRPKGEEGRRSAQHDTDRAADQPQAPIARRLPNLSHLAVRPQGGLAKPRGQHHGRCHAQGDACQPQPRARVLGLVFGMIFGGEGAGDDGQFGNRH